MKGESRAGVTRDRTCCQSGLTGGVDRDANGNTLSGGGRTNVWDSQNRFYQCTYDGKTSTFKYGADGLRRSTTFDDGTQSVTTDFVLDGQNVAQEMQDIDSDGTMECTATYLTGPRGNECRIDETSGSDRFRWYAFDGLGSVLGELAEPVYDEELGHDTVHLVATNDKYDVYGAVRVSGGTSVTNHKFVGALGHTTEAKIGGLIYMRARYYDPSVGRFISEDPGCNGNNWYVYANDNPVNLADPDGKSAKSVWQVLSAFLASVAAGVFLNAKTVGEAMVRLVVTGTEATYNFLADSGAGPRILGLFVAVVGGIVASPALPYVLVGALVIATLALAYYCYEASNAGPPVDGFKDGFAGDGVGGGGGGAW